MLIFASGENTVEVTIDEKITLTNPDIIFIFQNDTTFNKVGCLVGNDLSQYPEHGNIFLINNTTNPDPERAEIELQMGKGKYWVYEIADASDFDFENIDTTGLTELENGKYDYPLTVSSIPTYKTVVSEASIYNG